MNSYNKNLATVNENCAIVKKASDDTIKDITPNNGTESKDQGLTWHACVAAKIQKIQSNVRKEKSPSLGVTLNNTKTLATIDEGAELNCVDEAFCIQNKIKFCKTLETATAAGQNSMKLAGETLEAIILRPLLDKSVRWNLGKCVVVTNLGPNILIGEPAKKDNCIITLPHKKQIETIDENGLRKCMDYANKVQRVTIPEQLSTGSHLCRISESVTLLPDDHLQFSVPEIFSDSEIVISPRRDYMIKTGVTWPNAQVLKVVGNSILIPNSSGQCLNLKKN